MVESLCFDFFFWFVTAVFALKGQRSWEKSPNHEQWWLKNWCMLTKFQRATEDFRWKCFSMPRENKPSLHGITQLGLCHDYGPAPATCFIANSWHLFLSNANASLPNWSHLTYPHVVFFHCTMKTARKIVRRLQLRMHFNVQQNCRNSLMLTIIWANLSYPLTEIGFLCFSFFFSFQNKLTVFKEIPWTGLKWQLSFYIVCTKNLETLLEGKFSMIKGAFNTSNSSWH